MGSFQKFGSYLALVLRFTYYFLAPFQSFNLHNSMIKKLYSADPDDDEQQSHKERDKLTKAEKLEAVINDRQSISYSYLRFWLNKNFGKSWCLCCRYRAKRHDKLFAIGQNKLSSEIDILEIVKKLRVMMFSADMTLKRRQQKLVSFFDEHKLSVTKEEKAEQQRKRMKEKNRLGRDSKYLENDEQDEDGIQNMASQLDAKSAYHRVALAQ